MEYVFHPRSEIDARLAKALGEDVQFSDISANIKLIRSVKSDFEIRLIREAARILDAGI
ncbi:MAG: hypothetical protein M0Q13_10445 [Methanothrix sp.]|nr:hypothetical protein [Methanothrix sp.]